MKRALAFLPLGALAALVILFAGFSLHRNPEVAPDVLVGHPTPDVSLPRLAGGPPVSLRAEARGPVLVNFFASWCAPCQVEHPALIALQAEGVRIIGVAYKNDQADAEAYLARLGNPFAEVLADRDGRVGIEFGVSAVPETYLIGADGTILAKHSGALTAEAAETMLRQAPPSPR
jgi:cytochrome c biogenesis protein CcmG/thiol:disulfide interchange protein DsbE